MVRTYYRRPKRVQKLSREKILDLSFDLINAFRLVKTPLETALLLQDLLTKSEVENLAKRLRIAKLILKGDKHRDIAKETRCSVATVTKVSLWLNQGGDGFRNTISKLPSKYKIPKKLPRGPIEFHLPQTLIALAQYSLFRYQKAQDKKLESFWEKAEDKRLLDKQLQEYFKEEFKNKKKST